MAGVRIEGLEDVRRALKKLTREEIPTALRNAINDTARDVQKRLEVEISRVFHQPTPKVQRPFFLKKKATKERLAASIAIKDRQPWLKHVITQHVPGFQSYRNIRGMERQLIRVGLMREGQYLMPSRTMRLNKYGNITGAMAAKMLNDIGTFRNVAGYESTTNRSKRGFVWMTRKNKQGNKTTGFWYISRIRNGLFGALAMVVVDDRPDYSPRFKAYDVAKSYGSKVFARHTRKAIEYRLAARGRR